jgi:hypothetical protein
MSVRAATLGRDTRLESLSTNQSLFRGSRHGKSAAPCHRFPRTSSNEVPSHSGPGLPACCSANRNKPRRPASAYPSGRRLNPMRNQP